MEGYQKEGGGFGGMGGGGQLKQQPGRKTAKVKFSFFHPRFPFS